MAVQDKLLFGSDKDWCLLAVVRCMGDDWGGVLVCVVRWLGAYDTRMMEYLTALQVLHTIIRRKGTTITRSYHWETRYYVSHVKVEHTPLFHTPHS